MSVIRQFNFLSQMRLDVPHFRSLESAAAGDFDALVGRGMGGSKALILRGFSLNNVSSGGSAVGLQMSVADAIVINLNASESGSLLWVPTDKPIETLNPSTNTTIVGSWTPSAVNYVGIDFTRTADNTTTDLVQFLDSNTDLEEPREVPLGRTLSYQIVITTLPFASQSTIVPVAKVTLGSSGQITAVQDARPMMFRLGSGGDVPNSVGSFAWAQGRTETNTGVSNSLFLGGDKVISNQKDWMDAMMSRVWELGGGEAWYRPTADRNVNLVWVGSPFSNGEHYEWDGTNLHWTGLRFLFDNSTVYYRDVADQTTDLAGLTNLADGDCLYVDLDRSAVSPSLNARKASLISLGAATLPGHRWILAWRQGAYIYTRQWRYPVGTTFIPATNTSMGMVKLNQPNAVPLIPIVAGLNSSYGLNIGEVVGPNNGYAITGNNPGIKSTGGGNGHGVIGTGGASDGTGVFGKGGGVNGNGITGTAAFTSGPDTGTGSGVVGYGGKGATGGHGVVGSANAGANLGSIAPLSPHFVGVYGRGAKGGEGVIGVGGDLGGTGVGGFGANGTNGYGGWFTGGDTNGKGARGEGNGTGTGVEGAALGTGIGVDGIGGTANSGVRGTGGTGGGWGIEGVGGTGGGHGVIGTGGGPDGIGVYGIGTGTGAGVFAQAGAGKAVDATNSDINNPAIQAEAAGGAPGTISKGSVGVVGEGYAVANHGVAGVGDTTTLALPGGFPGIGVYGQGGNASAGPGLFGQGGGATGVGLIAQGGSNGWGASIAAGGTAVYGVRASVGALGSPPASTDAAAVYGAATVPAGPTYSQVVGVRGTASNYGAGGEFHNTSAGAGGPAIRVKDGGQRFVSNVLSSALETNTMIALNVPKHWCSFNTGGGVGPVVGPTVKGFNLFNAVVTAADVTVTFSTPMANASYAISHDIMTGFADTFTNEIRITAKGTTNFVFSIYRRDSVTGVTTLLDPSTDVRTVSFIVFAEQTV